MTEPSRAIVSWEGLGQPIVLTLYDSSGKCSAVRLEPRRALMLAQELLTWANRALGEESNNAE